MATYLVLHGANLMVSGACIAIVGTNNVKITYNGFRKEITTVVSDIMNLPLLVAHISKPFNGNYLKSGCGPDCLKLNEKDTQSFGFHYHIWDLPLD
uniref:Uncharacterized protein n=1 Tax=Glossina palpalis gambiensis TaxID=67801 RepID=A0A1B0BIC5_9MUSC